MAWSYAELSKTAKALGGPEALTDYLIDSGKATGRLEMLPLVLLSAAAGAACHYGVSKLLTIRKRKIAERSENEEKAKVLLIQGINEYDASHPEPDPNEPPVDEA